MATFIAAPLRAAVIERAHRRCEYCHKPAIGFYPHEVDHVVAQKHGGATAIENLAYACFECNRQKGSDIASIDPLNGDITPLFNPRTQNWNDHFRMADSRIIPLTANGRATVFLLH